MVFELIVLKSPESSIVGLLLKSLYEPLVATVANVGLFVTSSQSRLVDASSVTVVFPVWFTLKVPLVSVP